jgi:hypothetical protein
MVRVDMFRGLSPTILRSRSKRAKGQNLTADDHRRGRQVHEGVFSKEVEIR